MIKHIVIGILISGGCLYFLFRGIDLSALVNSLTSVHTLYIIPMVLATLFSHYLRCRRWGVILESLVTYDRKTLLMLGSVGFAAIGLLPARLGELVRPWLVNRQSRVPMISAMTTILVERVFDLLTLMLILCIVIPRIPLPGQVVKAGGTLLTAALFLFLTLIGLAVKKEASLEKINLLFNRLPERLRRFAERIFRAFFNGLEILPDARKTLHVGLLSLGVWLFQALSAYLMFFAFDLNLSFMNAMAITIIIVLGIMLPAAPGFLGTFHLACQIGLVGFGVSRETALSYAILLHFFQLFPVFLAGLVSLPFLNVPFSAKRS